MPKKSLRHIVIILPGILGSVLQKDGQDLWAISGQALGPALKSLGGSLQGLQLQADDPEIDDLGDGIEATHLMPDFHFIPGLVKIDGYTETVRWITNHFKVKQGNISIKDNTPANFFEFPYDWRRDNRVAARRLKQLIDQKLLLWRQDRGDEGAKVIFLAHSMGGLVARYYLEVLEGWQNCRALITFGTPYRGSVNAANFLSNGYKRAFLDLTNVVRSFTSVYQLLPIYKMVKNGDIYERVAETSGIPHISQQRSQQALEFHRAIENAVNTHLNDPLYSGPQGYKILPIIGTHQPTYQSCNLVDGKLLVSRGLPSGIDTLLGDGDGIVPRLSAIPIELSDEYRDTYFAERHASLQRNGSVLRGLLGRLETMQTQGLNTIRGPEPYLDGEGKAVISLDLDDLYTVDEPVELCAEAINWTAKTKSLKAQIEAIGTDAPLAIERPFRFEEGSWKMTLEGLPPGLYRLTVSSARVEPGMPSPVHDVFEIAR